MELCDRAFCCARAQAADCAGCPKLISAYRSAAPAPAAKKRKTSAKEGGAKTATAAKPAAKAKTGAQQSSSLAAPPKPAAAKTAKPQAAKKKKKRAPAKSALAPAQARLPSRVPCFQSCVFLKIATVIILARSTGALHCPLLRPRHTKPPLPRPGLPPLSRTSNTPFPVCGRLRPWSRRSLCSGS